MSTTVPSDARIALLSSLVDDAGVFPPASLPMREAVAEHAAAEDGEYAWIQGRFLCPAERLGELVGALPSDAGWPLSVIGGEPPPARVDAFAERVLADAMLAVRRSGGRLRLTAVEFRLPSEPVDPAAVLRAVAAAARRAHVASGVELFLEAPLAGSWLSSRSMVRAIGEARRGWPAGPVAAPAAKIRCGGALETTPSIPELAGFIAACAAAGVPFKATAGLHHPLAHSDLATGAHAHGFLNLAAATALLAAGALAPSALEDVLAERDPDALEVSARGLAWRDLWARSAVLARVRVERLRSYGSCSFSEPVEGLTALGILPLEESVA